MAGLASNSNSIGKTEGPDREEENGKEVNPEHLNGSKCASANE
jgi:hypothetical protein